MTFLPQMIASINSSLASSASNASHPSIPKAKDTHAAISIHFKHFFMRYPLHFSRLKKRRHKQCLLNKQQIKQQISYQFYNPTVYFPISPLSPPPMHGYRIKTVNDKAITPRKLRRDITLPACNPLPATHYPLPTTHYFFCVF